MSKQAFIEIETLKDYSKIYFMGKIMTCPHCNNDKFDMGNSLTFTCKKCRGVMTISIQFDAKKSNG